MDTKVSVCEKGCTAKKGVRNERRGELMSMIKYEVHEREIGKHNSWRTVEERVGSLCASSCDHRRDPIRPLRRVRLMSHRSSIYLRTTSCRQGHPPQFSARSRTRCYRSARKPRLDRLTRLWLPSWLACHLRVYRVRIKLLDGPRWIVMAGLRVGELVRVDEVIHLPGPYYIFAHHPLRILSPVRPSIAPRGQLLHMHGQVHRPGARPVPKEILPEPHKPIRALGVQRLHLRKPRGPLRPVLPCAAAPAHEHA